MTEPVASPIRRRLPVSLPPPPTLFNPSTIIVFFVVVLESFLPWACSVPPVLSRNVERALDAVLPPLPHLPPNSFLRRRVLTFGVFCSFSFNARGVPSSYLGCEQSFPTHAHNFLVSGLLGLIAGFSSNALVAIISAHGGFVQADCLESIA